MIEVNNITKKFGNFTALRDISCKIESGTIYGLVGSNGAGKSTLIRVITGVYKPDSGSVLADGLEVYENPEAKSRIYYLPDELFFLPSANLLRMAEFTKNTRKDFSYDKFHKYSKLFELSEKAPIASFSKGMKRLAATVIALSCSPEYLFFDETFDGLDPVMRNLVKKVIYEDIGSRGAGAVITSHSLRELEDTCDCLSLLHKGGLVFESTVENLKTKLFKVQVAFDSEFGKEVFGDSEVISFEKRGKVANAILKGSKEQVLDTLRRNAPLLLEVLPLSLEEIFIYETEALGYKFDIEKEEESK